MVIFGWFAGVCGGLRIYISNVPIILHGQSVKIFASISFSYTCL